jgi:hypothetical protein
MILNKYLLDIIGGGGGLTTGISKNGTLICVNVSFFATQNDILHFISIPPNMLRKISKVFK